MLERVTALTERGIRPERPAGPGRPDLLLSGLPRRRRPAPAARRGGDVRNACPELTRDLADPAPKIDGRVHVGFVSQYWYQHTIAKLNLGLIRTLDRRRFHVTLFTTPHAGDAMRAALVAASDRVVELPVELAGARKLIAAERLDALYYADIGMSALTYFLAFARLAPLQCLTWGHPDTTGIAQPRPLPELRRHGAGVGRERHYSETLVRLPGPTLHYARPACRPGRSRARPSACPRTPTSTSARRACSRSIPTSTGRWSSCCGAIPVGLVVLISGQDRNLDELLRRRLDGCRAGRGRADPLPAPDAAGGLPQSGGGQRRHARPAALQRRQHQPGGLGARHPDRRPGRAPSCAAGTPTASTS